MRPYRVVQTQMKINPRLALILFLAPVFMALLYVYTIRETSRTSAEEHIRSGIVAQFEGNLISRDDIRRYFQTPPPEESPILRGLEITPEDVAGLEEEDPAWFQEEQGQLLISRVIKHIALLKHFLAQNPAPIQKLLDAEVKAYREDFMVEAIEAELDREKPFVKQEEMLDYYVKHPQEFHREEMRYARHIMLSQLPDSETSGSETTPNEILTSLQEGEDFQNLVLESESVSKESAGMLGWITRGSLAATFEEALWSLEIGEITGPVQVGDTLHFVQLLDEQKEELLPLREAMEPIRGILQAQKKQRHRFEVLNLSPETMRLSDPSTSEEYRTALLKAAYERGLEQKPDIVQKTETFSSYRKADLLFNDYLEKHRHKSPLQSEADTTIQLEIETVKQILQKIHFEILVKLNIPENGLE